MILQCDITKDYHYNIELLILIVFGCKHHFHLFIYLLFIKKSLLFAKDDVIFTLYGFLKHVTLIYYRPSPLFIGSRQTKFPGNAVFFIARAHCSDAYCTIGRNAVLLFLFRTAWTINVDTLWPWSINHGKKGIEYDRRTIDSAITWSFMSSCIINDSWIQSYLLFSHWR